MEIKKFEAFKYRGPALMNANRQDVIKQIADSFLDNDLFGYTCNGTRYDSTDEVLYLYLDDENENKVLRLDLSDMGIEIGILPYDKKLDTELDFVSEINLDTTQTKFFKNYKKDMNKFNL